MIMKKYISLFIVGVLFTSLLSSCGDSWFEKDPQNILTDEQVWNDPALIKSQLANIYNRMPQLHGDFNTGGMTEVDDAMYSGTMDQNYRNELQYGDDYGRWWDYGLIRDINMSIEKLDKFSTGLGTEQKALFNAEFRFLRAYVYFELVRRMGGVPLITTTLEYDFSGDPSYLQNPRAKEHEIYDFIYTEIQSIKDQLASNNGSQTRANTYTALALQSRAMLYAGSIAKYNNELTPAVKTDGGEVGISASMANDYYKKSLEASKAIIAGPYELYNSNPDKGKNFYDLFMTKTGNKEIIFAKDYLAPTKVHRFAYDNIVRHLTEDNESSSTIAPSLSLVESYDYLDGSKGTLHYKDANGNYIVYENQTTIFANKDARLYGTIVYPGTKFRSIDVDIQAGVAIWNATTGTYDLSVNPTLGSNYEDGKTWTGLDGPKDNAPDVSNTGFYIRKFVSEASAASSRGTGCENWWPWFRLGEIYLNAAEAAFELGETTPTPESYINKLRERAGFPANSIEHLTLEKIQNERRVELAFEDHRYFDMKRWRIADKTWDGTYNDNTVVYGLYPYRVAVAKPGTDDKDKFIFDKATLTRFKRPRLFRLANYYSSIDQNVINNNPKIVKNPFH
ncbi:RagB/SusD family nutrient uptake outer membrane protein [Bacteroides oleiciplenus]|nr:RagB/SusD family nutrient uptake outer membrane protein [Bacteroides oleiciplenus]RGN31468.1 RagB/SusD family nutrient uptake outer membrane protein [Bacteroides oleiciplenus]